MDPAATPYDILPVPVIAYDPGGGEWLALALAAVLLAALLRLGRSAMRRRPDAGAVLQQALQALLAAGGPEALPRASLAVKRYLSLSERKNYAAMGPRELERQVQGCRDNDLRAVLSLVLAIDLGKYGAGLSGLDSAATLRWLRSAVAAYGKRSKAREGTA